MSRKSDGVKAWRKRTKKRMIDAMGGKCVCCGYYECQEAMVFHHFDPTKKEIGFGKTMSHPVKWERIVKELRKCVLVCNRCHSEIHAGYRKLPSNCAAFNNNYVVYKKPPLMDDCPICGEEKPIANITCSKSCAAKKSRKVNWDAVDLGRLLTKHSFIAIGDMLGVSDAAVHKRAKKLGIHP